MNKIQWAGIPFEKRYSQSASAPKWLVKEMRKIDDLLDLKFYMPTECWHVVRYPHGRNAGFVRCWECNDNPGKRRDLGQWIIDALKKGDTWNRDVVKEIDESNKQRDESFARSQEDVCKEISKDMLKPLQDLYDYGDKAETHYNYAVGSVKEEKKEGFVVRDKRKICTSIN